MSAVAKFRRRTVASARDAARLYFEPLLILRGTTATVEESGPLHRFHPLAVGSTSHWERGLVYWRRSVKQAESPAGRRSEARAALAWSEAASQEMERLRRVSEADYEELMERWHANVGDHKLTVRPLYYQTLLSGWFRTAAWLLTAMEVALAALFLSTSFQFDLVIAVGIGALVTLILTMGATVILSALILAGLESQPIRARQVLLPQIVVIGFAIFALVGAILFARVSGAASTKLLEYFLVCLVMMTPVLVGLLQSGARLFGWSNELTRHQQRLEELKIEVDSLTVYLDVLLKDGPEESLPLGTGRRQRTVRDLIKTDDDQTV